MKSFLIDIQKKFVQVAIIIVAFLIFATVLNFVRTFMIMDETNQTKNEVEKVLEQKKQISRFFNLYDLGLRGYAITQDKNLLHPFNIGRDSMPVAIDQSRLIIVKHGLNPENLDNFKVKIGDYTKLCEGMIKMIEQDSINDFRAKLKEDVGYSIWMVFDKYFTEMEAHEAKVKAAAIDRYETAMTLNIIFLVLLFIIGAPTLIFVLFRLKKQEQHRLNLVKNLEENNRRYFFNPGTDIQLNEKVMEESIANIKTASQFISEIGKGNFEIEWPGLDEKNKELNKETLAAALIDMRNKMKLVKEEDEKRMWATEGIAKFSEIIRNQQNDIQNLCDDAVKFITKYLKAQQGGLFIKRGESKDDSYLELAACYAFERKKFINKRIEVGDGLIGQIYLEGETTMLTEIPQGYTNITSGTGGATPNCLIIVPMKNNDSVEAIIELAGFVVYEDYQIGFIEKCGEYLASILSTVKISEQTSYLLQQSQLQAEQLRTQEEELRQNMEELAATNEEMKRKEEDLMKKWMALEENQKQHSQEDNF